jgi:cytidylate kinase
MEHLGRHFAARRKAAQQTGAFPNALTIAISREAGTQGTLVAREAANRLGWPVYDQELLELIARDMRLRTSVLESVDERRKGWLQATAEAFMSPPPRDDLGTVATESGYVHHLIKVVLALGTHGECVIVGRGSPFILPVETTLRVRLMGPERGRVENFARVLGVPEDEAARRARHLDRERAAFVRRHFFKDAADPRNYDLALNVSRLHPPRCAALIVEAVHQIQASEPLNAP